MEPRLTLISTLNAAVAKNLLLNAQQKLKEHSASVFSFAFYAFEKGICNFHLFMRVEIKETSL